MTTADFEVLAPRAHTAGKLATTLLWALVAVMAVTMVARASSISYSPDSWSYVDIARGLISQERGVGDILIARDYTNVPWVNDSFPFLFPVLLVPGLAILGPSAPVGAYLFVVVWLLTCLVIGATLSQLRLPGLVAPLVGLAVLALPGYVDEGRAGRSIPLTVLLLMTAVAILLRTHRRDLGMPVLLGVVLGLCAANRFDGLAYGPVFIVLAALFGLLALRQSLIVFGVWMAFPMLWVVYSMSRLGGVYLTDNGRVVTSPVATYVTDWPAAVPSGDPGLGGIARKVVDNLSQATSSLESAFSEWVVLAVVAILVAVVLQLAAGGRVRSFLAWLVSVAIPRRRTQQFLLALAAVLALLQLLLISLSGYGDVRYWAPFGAVGLLALVFWLADMTGSARNRERSWALITRGSSVAIFVVLIAGLGVTLTLRGFAVKGDQTAGDAAILSCIEQVDGTVMIPGVPAFRLPATGDVRSATPPANADDMTPEDWRQLSATYGVVAWLNPTGEPDNEPPEASTGVLTRLECPLG